MNPPLPPNGRLEVRDADGRVVGYFVPAEELARLEAEMEALRQDRESLERQLVALLPVATPEEEAEMQQLMATAVPLDLSGIIAELEANRGA